MGSRPCRSAHLTDSEHWMILEAGQLRELWPHMAPGDLAVAGDDGSPFLDWDLARARSRFAPCCSTCPGRQLEDRGPSPIRHPGKLDRGSGRPRTPRGDSGGAAWRACLTSLWALHAERSIAVRCGLQTKLPQTGRDQLVHQGGRERLVHGKVQRPFGALVTCEVGGQRRQD